MYEIGLNYFYPRDQEFTFVNTVSKNKEGFTARQIKVAEVAKAFYATLIYPSAQEYNLVICSNQINNCPVTVQYVEVTQKVWGKNITALKFKTTRKNLYVVARD